MAERGTPRHGHGRDVWIVNHYADAPDRARGSRHFDLARYLVARGHPVTVFAAGIHHTSGREERLHGFSLYSVKEFEGVRFVWLRTFPYHGNTWRRQVNMVSFLIVFVVVQGRFEKPGVIVGSTVHPFAALGAWVASRLRRARFVFEIRDLWPQTLIDLGALREGAPGERLLRAIEAFLVRRATVVLTLLPRLADYLREHGLPSDRVVYVPNGVDLAAFDAAAASETNDPQVTRALQAIEHLRAEGRMVFGYLGSFGLVNRLDVVIRAASIAEERAPGRVGLVLIGEGAERNELEQLAAGAAQIAFGPHVPRTQVPGILRHLDAGVVHAVATPVYRYGISFNKVFEYMAASLPVVFACESAYDPVALADAGVSVAPGAPELLATAFLTLAQAGEPERAAMGARGRAYVEAEHNVERLGPQFADTLGGLFPEGPATRLTSGQEGQTSR